MMRWGSICSVAAGLLCVAGGPVYAAPAFPSARMEMIVLLPSHRYLAVYEQLAMAQSASSLAFGILPGATDLHPIGTAMVRAGPDELVLKGSAMKFAVRYKIPWNGQSGSYHLPSYQADGTMILLLPSDLRLPAVLNPAMALVGKGQIPGVKDSPEFDEYATSNVPRGETLNFVLEHGQKVAGLSRVISKMPSLPIRLGSLLQIVIAGLALVALGAAASLKPAPASLRLPGLKDQLLGELAVLEATYRRDEILEDVYSKERSTLLGELQGIWHNDTPAG